MLGKLLKYDFRTMYRELIFIYVITLLLALVIKVVDVFKYKLPILMFMQTLTVILFVISLLATFLYTFFAAVKIFYNNMLKDEAYLTHTLPVEKRKILLSKGIVALIWYIISLIVIIISLLIVLPGLVENIASVFDLLSGGMNKIFLCTILVAVLLFSYLQYLFGFILALSLGHSKLSNKMVKSFVYGLVIYMIWEMASLIMLGIVWVFVPEISEMIENEVFNSDSMVILYIASIALQMVMISVEYKLSVITLNKKLNLE